MPSSHTAFPTCRPLRTKDGVRWRVWAPRAKTVDLLLGDESARHSLDVEADGYFSIEVDGVSSGQSYAYSIDGGPARPDPCSLSQPGGVHRPSALYFPEEFEYRHPPVDIPRSDLVIYEMHIGTFTGGGTFDAASARLDDLVDLGINAIEVLPVSQFPGTRNWGYDGVHPYATQHSYGGPHGFQGFIDAAHARGLAVFLDVVFNHLGPEGNYLNEFGPYFNPNVPTPWGPAFNYDGDNSEPVRNWVLDCVWHWIHDFRLDGLRFDAVHAIHDQSKPHLLTKITETAERAAASRGGKPILIAESLLNDDVMVTPRSEGGHGFDAEWNEDFHHAVSAWMTGERTGKYVDYGDHRAIENVYRDTFHLAGIHSEYYQGVWGRPAADTPGDRFVISLQNHDHIGNRACGERLAHLVDEPRLRLGACLTLLAPYIPMLYMGEEYGETNPFLFFCEFGDKKLIASVRRGRKRDYGLSGNIPDPQSEDSFARSRLSWDWKAPARARLRSLYRDLIRLRKATPELREYREKTVTMAGDVLEIRRGEVLCRFNLGDHTAPLPEGEGVIWRSENGGKEMAPFETVVLTSATAPGSGA